MRQAGTVTFAQSRAFDRYVLARIDARIAKKEAESLEASKRIVTTMKSQDAQGRMSPKAVADLNWLFNNGSQEERALVRRELGKSLKP